MQSDQSQWLPPYLRSHYRTLYAIPPDVSARLPHIRISYSACGYWHQDAFNLAAPFALGGYEHVDWSEDVTDAWMVESYATFCEPRPAFINRSLGQRRIFVSAEGYDFSRIVDYDAIIDTKLWPYTHPWNVPNVFLPYYAVAYHNLPDRADLIKPSTLEGVARWSNFTQRRFAAYVHNHCHFFRDSVFDMLNAYKKVDALSNCRHNTNRSDIDPTVSTSWTDVSKLYRHYKFVITVENHWTAGYMTEKVITAMIAGAIPIYLGAPDISEHFNDESFVHLEHYADLKDAVNWVAYLDRNDTAYLEVLARPWLKGNVLNRWLVNSPDNLFVQQLIKLKEVLHAPGYTFDVNETLADWVKPL